MHHLKSLAALAVVLAVAVTGFAQELLEPQTPELESPEAAEPALEMPAPEPVAPETPAPAAGLGKLVVIMPEQVDSEWFWYYYTETSEHVVQAAVEKELIRAGHDVIDLDTVNVFQGDGTIGEVQNSGFACRKAAEMGATHLVLGRATATRASQDSAYGVTVIRSTAEITAKLIRVSDAKVLAVEDASATAGGQAQMAAGREALKEAGKIIAQKMARAVQEKLGGAPQGAE